MRGEVDIVGNLDEMEGNSAGKEAMAALKIEGLAAIV